MGSDSIGDIPYSFDFNHDNYPLTSGGSTNFNIPLIVGWNFISLPRIQENTSVEAVLASVAGQWDVVKYYDASDILDPWKTYRVGGTANDLFDLDHTMGFWLHATENCTLSLNGEAPVTTSISLKAGWNMVGYASGTPHLASNALPSEVDIVSVSSGNYGSIIDYTDLSLITMEAGKGYYVHCTADCIWTVDW